MSIILNEYDYAEKSIRDRELGKKPIETINRVAKYYIYSGYSKKEARELLDGFLLRCDPNASVAKWADTLDLAVKNAIKYPLIMIDEILITDSEIQKINSVKSKQAQRLAFTLLCVAKFKHIVRPTNEYWVNTPDNEIMSMANVNTSIKRQSMLFGLLKDAGLIQFSKKIDNLNVQVLFADNGDPIVHISDFRNLGYQYLKYCGEPYFECQYCGLTLKQSTGSGRKQKYCPSCAAKVKMQQSVNSMMRIRTKAS